MKLLTLFIIMSSLCAVALASNIIGAKQTLDQTAFDEIARVAEPLIVKEVRELQIPDLHGHASTPVGSVKYDLTQIKVNGIKIDGLIIKPVDGGLHVECDGLAALVHLNWHYKYLFVSDSGSADIEIDEATFAMDLGITESEGEPVLAVNSCSVHINHITIILHGGASWLYELLESIFEGSIKAAIESGLHDEFVDVVTKQVNPILASLPTTADIGSFLEIDFQQTANPACSASARTLTTFHKAEFYSISSPSECPGQPADLPSNFTDRMSQVFVSDWSMNSAGFAAYKAGMLSFILTDSDLPASSPFRLNTSSFEILLPELYAKYPNMLMELVGNAVAQPDLVISVAEGIEISGKVEIAVDVVENNGSLIETFTFDVALAAGATVGFKGNNVTGNIDYVNISLALVESHIGPLNLTLLQDMLQGIISGPILTLLNDLLAVGYPIPVLEGISLVDPEVECFDGYLAIGTDLAYNQNSEDYEYIHHI